MKKIFKLFVLFFLLTDILLAEEVKVFDFTEEEISTLEVKKVRGADTKTQYFFRFQREWQFFKSRS